MQNKIIKCSIIMLGITICCIVALIAYQNRSEIKIIAAKTLNINLLYFPPQDTSIKIDSTNLPIVFISSTKIEKDFYTEAQITIIDNGEGKYNYGDTVLHHHQRIDFKGTTLLKHHGYTSYVFSPKKSYTLKILDKPLKDGGDKNNISLLELNKGSKYVLKALHFERSMIREVLSYELARPFMDYVPSTRYCEVIINGVYYGLFQLTEQPTRKRLKAKKKKHDKKGGLILYYSRERDADYTMRTIVNKKDTLSFTYRLKYPDKAIIEKRDIEDIHADIDQMIRYMAMGDKQYKDYIDETSMIDYQLLTEFTHNVDGYAWSMYMYKRDDSTESRYKLIPWDYDNTFGWCSWPGFGTFDNWIFADLNSPSKNNQQKGPKWWYRYLMKNEEYKKSISERWKEYRGDVYSSYHINHLIDSLVQVITEGKAIERNNQAWKIWNEWGASPVNSMKYTSESHLDEVRYIRDWIDKRLQWMDWQLLNNELIETNILKK